MVNIPTARDVGYNNPRSGRIANSGPTPMVGAAMQDAGQSIVQASYSLLELAEREKIDVANDRSNAVSTSLTRFLADEEQRFLKAREESSESGIGFTRQFMEGHQQRANDFAKANFEGLTKDAQTTYLNNILARGNVLYEKADEYERNAKGAYYDRTTNTNLDTYRTQIRNNAANFEDLKRQGLEAINSANMPEPWKAARRQQWEADAAESKWRWKFSQNPTQALADLKPSGTKSLIRAEEGFRDEPYRDVNAWRIGYGSDTVTLADGSHVPVKPGMKITREDAERDLQYRLAEREGKRAREQIGAKWDSLPLNTRAALESVAYNYGSLPGEVVDAVKTGDTEAVASAVEGLSANPNRRKREAALIRGGGSVEPDDEYAAIPHDRREVLAAWGETEHSQQVTKDRVTTKHHYDDLIATEPDTVRESVILDDPKLDNGDKAVLVNALRTAQKDSGAVNAMIGAMAKGDVSVNSFDNDQTKVANNAYDKLIGAAKDADEQRAITSDFVARTRYIPKRVQAELRNGAASTDAATMAQAMEASLSLSKTAPASFDAFEGSAAVRKKMDVYRAFTQDMGFTPEEAAKKLIKANDPAYAGPREALFKSKTVADELKKVDAASIAATFDNSFLGIASNPSLGPNEMAAAAMVENFRSIYEEAIVDAGGDLVAAKKAATERFHRTYGVSALSTMGSKVVVKNPPEKRYPVGPDGSHDYIRNQLAADLKKNGIEADEVFLNPNIDTDQDIRAGRPASYHVFYEKNGQLQMFNFPFYPDPEAAKAEALKASEAINKKNKAAIIEDTAAGKDALAATEGSPASIQAQAVEAARYKSRLERARREERVANPGPLGGSNNADELQPTPWNAM